MTHEGEISVGIGFATGRRSFQSVLGTFIYHLEESGLLEQPEYPSEFAGGL